MLNDIERSWYHWMIGFLIPHIEHGHFWQNEQVNIASMKVLFSAGTPGDFCKEPTRHTRWNWTSSNSGQPWQFRASNCSWNLPVVQERYPTVPGESSAWKITQLHEVGYTCHFSRRVAIHELQESPQKYAAVISVYKKNQDFASHFSWSRRVVIQ